MIRITACAAPSAQFEPGVELGRDHRARHVPLRSAKHQRGDVVAGQRDEDQEQPGDDPGRRERERHLAEGLPAAGAEILRGLAHRWIQPVERHEQREDHQRQVVVDDARAARRHGSAADAVAHSRSPQFCSRVDTGPDGSQEDQPSDRADQEVHEERHDDQAEQHAPPSAPSRGSRASTRTGTRSTSRGAVPRIEICSVWEKTCTNAPEKPSLYRSSDSLSVAIGWKMFGL